MKGLQNVWLARCNNLNPLRQAILFDLKGFGRNKTASGFKITKRLHSLLPYTPNHWWEGEGESTTNQGLKTTGKTRLAVRSTYVSFQMIASFLSPLPQHLKLEGVDKKPHTDYKPQFSAPGLHSTHSCMWCMQLWVGWKLGDGLTKCPAHASVDNINRQSNGCWSNTPTGSRRSTPLPH